MRREIAEGCHVPGRTDQGFKTPRWSAGRRCRVPLFPGDPGNTPRLVKGAPFGVPPSPQCREGGILANLGRITRRENAKTWLFEIRIRNRRAAPSSPRPALAGRGRERSERVRGEAL